MRYFASGFYLHEAGDPLLSANRCVLHNDDNRLPSYYRELHHVVPQAWQAVWWPSENNGDAVFSHTAPSAAGELQGHGYYLPKQKVWDPRTEPCCPTGHRNVHYLLVAMMKKWQSSYQDLWSQTEDRILECKRAVVNDMHAAAYAAGPKEAAMAVLAMTRWNEWGGDLRLLTSRKLYGYA